jgi:glycosyltransferase involved in cell wall biosynthesis
MTLPELAPELSIVIPCYNEEANVVGIHAAVKAEALAHARSHEIIFIDNLSSDRTRELLRQICAADPDTRAIFNTRNYGQMRSPTHALYQTTGSAVIGMCADFQDPPAMIGAFVAQWRAGAQIVLAQRRTEHSAGLLTVIRNLGYRMLAAVSDDPIVRNATGFGLYDRAVIDTVSQIHEPEPFFRGMVVETGYRLAIVPFDRPARAGGVTKNNWLTITAFALSALSGSARSLLRAPLYLVLPGLLITLVLVMAAIAMLVSGHATGWWLLLGAVQFALVSAIALFLGLIGDQVRLIAERTRRTPLVVEAERINFPAERGQPAR